MKLRLKKNGEPIKKLSVVAIVLSCIAICGQIFVFATQKENPEETWQKAIKTSYRIFAPPMPDSLTFAGEPVPLDVYYVRESLDKELMVNMYLQSKMLSWMKRANRYFPTIDSILKANEVPADFKYLAVAESGLDNVTSGAGAVGYWQIMSATGTSLGLEINDQVDMRRDLVASTQAACKYLKGAYKRLGSWTAAAASYNCGEGGLHSRMAKQETDSYYHTRLNTETGRYVYRILAIKLIMQHPQTYGYYLRKCDLYPVIPSTTIEVKGQNVDLYKFSKEHGISYKVLRELNPWITAETLTNKSGKTYQVKIPNKDTLKVKAKGTELVKGL